MFKVLGSAADGDIDIRQSVSGREKDEQIITVSPDEVSLLVAQLIAAAVCVKQGHNFPPTGEAKDVRVN